MEIPVKLLVVEDDMIIAAKISMQLTKLGYEVTGIVPRGEEAVRHVDENRPDIILLDINLKGALDGIQTAHAIHRLWDIPIIYVTANTDEATFNRAKETRPYAFIAKPIKNIDLQRAIELTISRIANKPVAPATNSEESLTDSPEADSDAPFVLNDRIFVRYRDKMVRIVIGEILYIEAERNYCHIVTTDKEYLLTTTLKLMEDKLPARQFLRIHRSYVVNLLRIDEVGENHLGIAGKSIPLSHLLREDLLKRIQTI
jgi:DNA-binding LytR/AlgR family response regulator